MEPTMTLVSVNWWWVKLDLKTMMSCILKNTLLLYLTSEHSDETQSTHGKFT